MPKKRFSEEQIAFALRQADAGTSVGEICRKMGVAEATFYRWKKVYAGMGVSEIRRLKQREDEWDKLVSGDVAKYNELAKKLDLPKVVVPAVKK